MISDLQNLIVQIDECINSTEDMFILADVTQMKTEVEKMVA